MRCERVPQAHSIFSDSIRIIEYQMNRTPKIVDPFNEFLHPMSKNITSLIYDDVKTIRRINRIRKFIAVYIYKYRECVRVEPHDKGMGV